MKKCLPLLLSLAVLTCPISAKTRQEIEAQYTQQVSKARTGPERGQAIRDWGVAAKAAGVPNNELQAIWVGRIQELMRQDFYAAYEAILEADYLEDEPKKTAALFPEQQAALRKLAEYTVANYRKEGSAPYPADVPLPGHPWGDLTRTPVAGPSPSPASRPAAWQPRWNPGQFFENADGQVCSVLLRVDPSSKKYLFLTRKWYPKAEPYFLTAQEYGHYILEETWFDEQSLNGACGRPTTNKYRACSQCGGEACQYVEGGRARGGQWEEVSPTLKIYTPRRVPLSYTKVVCCPGCGGQGWLKR